MSEWASDLNWGNKQLDRAVELLKVNYPKAKFISTIKGGETDKEFGGDLKVQFLHKQEIWATKFRRMKYKSFGDITIEYKNGDGSFGDWQKFKGGAIQKYVYGYANGDIEFWVIDVRKLLDIPEEYFKIHYNQLHGKSTFKTISLKEAYEFGAIENHLKEQQSPNKLNDSTKEQQSGGCSLS